MLHLPDGNVAAPEYVDLENKIRNGDGIHWAGDPALWLGIGVVTNGQRTGRRLEVWRDNEDGSTTLISHWRPEDQFRILFDLASMRSERPGAVSVLDQIDKANDALQEEHDRAARESMYETLEHALKLDHDRNNPKQTFYMNDIKDPPTPAPADPAT